MLSSWKSCWIAAVNNTELKSADKYCSPGSVVLNNLPWSQLLMSDHQPTSCGSGVDIFTRLMAAGPYARYDLSLFPPPNQ